MFGLSEAIVGLVSAILGGEELGLTSGLYLSWTTSGLGSSGVELLGTTGSAAGGDVDTVEAFVPEPVNKPLLKLQKRILFKFRISTVKVYERWRYQRNLMFNVM